MRLGIDSRDIFAREPRGIGNAMALLLRYLLPLVPDWRFALYTNRKPDNDGSLSELARYLDMPGDRWNTWERIRLAVASFTDKLNLLHCPSQTAPSWASCPIILTVHDVIPLRIGDGWSENHIRLFRRRLAHSLQRAARIIAVSEFTKRDILMSFSIPEKKIDVIHWGVERKTESSMTEDAWLTWCLEARVRRPFFFGFGGGAPRKNVPRLLKAFSMFLHETNQDAQLVLVGVPLAVEPWFGQLAAELEINQNVRFLGYVSDEIVVQLLTHTEALLFLSLYEGFGLPILEAMAVGAPVVTSNVTSMPEIAGDAAITVDPTDDNAMVEAMKAIYLNDRVKDKLRKSGEARILHFSWRRAAAETLAVYRKSLQ